MFGRKEGFSFGDSSQIQGNPSQNTNTFVSPTSHYQNNPNLNYGNQNQTSSLFGNNPNPQPSMFGNPGPKVGMFPNVGGNMNMNQNNPIFNNPQNAPPMNNPNIFLSSQTDGYFNKPKISETDNIMMNGTIYRDDGWKKIKKEEVEEIDFKYKFLLSRNPDLMSQLSDINTYNSKKFGELKNEQRFESMVRNVDTLIEEKSKHIKEVLETALKVQETLDNSVLVKSKDIFIKFNKVNLLLKEYGQILIKLKVEYFKLNEIFVDKKNILSKLQNDYQISYTIPSIDTLKIHSILREKLREIKKIILDLTDLYVSFEDYQSKEEAVDMEENLETLKDLIIYIQGLLTEADELASVISNLKKNRLGSQDIEIEEENQLNNANGDIYDMISNKLNVLKEKLESIN